MERIDAFVDFMRSYENMVFATAVRLLGNEPDAADIAQEVFLKAHEHFEMLQGNPKAGGWLKTVTTNLSLNHLTRYRARWSFFSELGKSNDAYDFENFIASEDNRSKIDEDDHRRHYLELALRKLPSAQRVPLVLYHFDELTYEEIAVKLRISLSKVKTDIHRGRESLRKWLSPHLEDNMDCAGNDVATKPHDQELKRSLFPWPQWSEGI